METILGVFDFAPQAVHVVKQLRRFGIGEREIGYITPNASSKARTRLVQVSDTEESGMGKTIGATVGGAIGVAGGVALGVVVANLMIPGGVAVTALGFLGAALLGGTGAFVGGAVGDALEESLGEGLPHEDFYVYEDALRHGKSIVIVHAEKGRKADEVRDVMKREGAEDLNDLRERWLAELQDPAATDEQSSDREVRFDGLSYLKGFKPKLRTDRTKRGLEGKK